MNHFDYHTTIKLHETDAAGVLFFSNLLKIAHDAFEAFLENIKFPMIEILDKLNFNLVIVHTDADYLYPLKVNDQLDIHLNVESIGTTSFTMSYQFKNMKNKVVGKVKTVHVCLDKKSAEKRVVPDKFKTSLSSFL